MKGYTSEKRDLDISELEEKVNVEIKDIARNRLNETLEYYDRGVRWDYEGMNYSGKQWLSAYLPVWLYSCYDQHGVLNYIAVNGRTGETVGIVPFSRKKLYLIALAILLSTLLFAGISLLGFVYENVILVLMFMASFFIVPAVIVFLLVLIVFEEIKYSNLTWVRHHYEVETPCNIDYINKVDEKTEFISNSNLGSFEHANNERIYGEYVQVKKNTK